MQTAVKSVVEIGVAVTPIRDAKPLSSRLSGWVNIGTRWTAGCRVAVEIGVAVDPIRDKGPLKVGYGRCRNERQTGGEEEDEFGTVFSKLVEIDQILVIDVSKTSCNPNSGLRMSCSVADVWRED